MPKQGGHEEAELWMTIRWANREFKEDTVKNIEPNKSRKLIMNIMEPLDNKRVKVFKER